MARSDTLTLSLRAARIRSTLHTLRRDSEQFGDPKLLRELDAAILCVSHVHETLTATAPTAKSSPMSFSLSMEMLDALRHGAKRGSANQSLVIRQSIEGFLDRLEGPLPPEEDQHWDARVSTRLPIALLQRIHEVSMRNGVPKSVILRLALLDMQARRASQGELP